MSMQKNHLRMSQIEKARRAESKLNFLKGFDVSSAIVEHDHWSKMRITNLMLGFELLWPAQQLIVEI